MTREEAITILQEKYDYCKSFYDLAAHPEEDYPEMAKYLQALQIALSALRPVSRDRIEKVWSGCHECSGCKLCIWNETKKCNDCKNRNSFRPLSDFCPRCGKPLTDAAVDMVMERLEALYGES